MSRTSLFFVSSFKFSFNIRLTRTSIIVSLLKAQGILIIYTPSPKHFVWSTNTYFLTFKYQRLKRLILLQIHWSQEAILVHWELQYSTFPTSFFSKHGLESTQKKSSTNPKVALITLIIPNKETFVLSSIKNTGGAVKMEYQCTCTDEMDEYLTTHNWKVSTFMLHWTPKYTSLCFIPSNIQ